MLLFGAPGVGKGTQGHLLGHIPGMYHLATGDMFRGLDTSSKLGQKFLEYSSEGLLVPDDLTIELWQQHVQSLINRHQYSPRTDLLVLDGIPRSLAQAQTMDGRIEVVKIIHLVAPDQNELVHRIQRRAEQQGRHDDADEAVIRRRLEVYDAETRPVLEHYDNGVLDEVSAIGRPGEVLLHVLERVVPVCNEHFSNPME